MRAFVVATFVAGLALVACGPQADPGADAGPPAKFSEIYEKFFPIETRAQCNFCHSNPPNDISNGNLSMGSDKDTAYAAIIGVDSAGSRCAGQAQKLVVAGDPDHSLFYLKTAGTPDCGGRMPLGGTPLTDAEREMIHGWILNGAPND